METVAERIKKVRLATGLNPRQFALAANLNTSNYYKIEAGTLGVKTNSLQSISTHFRVSMEWLLTGEGEMFLPAIDTGNENGIVKESDPILRKSERFKTQQNDNAMPEIRRHFAPSEKKRVPLFDVEASAGENNEVDLAPVSNPVRYIELGDMLSNDSQAALSIYGNSMTPSYPPGCIVGLRQNLDGIIQPGEVYVIEIESNRLLKRLFYTEDNTGYECYSDNTLAFESGPKKGKFMYPPFNVKFEAVRRLFDVTGVIKRNRNSAVMQKAM